MSNITHGTKLVKLAPIKVTHSCFVARNETTENLFSEKSDGHFNPNLFLSSMSILGLWEASEREPGVYL
jgi:hypothetical protein